MTTLVVSQEGLRNYILEGVDNLRVRKCRPDRETIAHYVLRKYGGSLNDIFNELENIVDEGLLLKVEYKGSTSYRTPQSFDLKNSPLLTKHAKILNSTRTTRVILTTINDLLTRNPDYCTLGIPLEELKVKLKEEEPVRFADDKVDTAFGREVSIGNVLLGDGGRVYPKDIQPIRKQQLASNASGSSPNGKVADSSSNNSSADKVPKKRGRKSNAEKAALAAAAAATTPGSEVTKEEEVKDKPEDKPEVKVEVKPEVKPKAAAAAKNKKKVEAEPVKPAIKKDGGEAKIEEKLAEAVKKTFDGRVSGRNKIKRKVFDPSDLPSPPKPALSAKKKKRSSSSNEAVDTCEICNKKSDAKNLIICSTCAVSYHTGCLGLTKDQITNIVLSDWLCSDCRICNACSSPLKTSNHVECVKCKSGFHTVCVGDEADFICGECVFNKTSKDAQPISAQSSPPAPKRKGRPPKGRKSSASALASESAPPSSPTKDSAAAERRKSTTPTAETLDSSEELKTEDNNMSDDTTKNESVETASSTNKSPDKSTAAAATTTTTATSQTPEKVEKAEGSSNNQVVDNDVEMKEEKNEEEETSSDTEVVKLEDRPSELDNKKCSEWTPQDVEQYFNDKGLPEAGALFREQEVDGLSLLLMKRSDVIFGLRLRLGPALKVYKLILQLQNNVTT